MRFTLAQILGHMPTPVNFRERNALELDGFSEYITDVTLDQRNKIDELAAQIVKSNDTKDPVYGFLVEGFADVARRISDLIERKWFENNISGERARNGYNLLVEALQRKGGDVFAEKIKNKSKASGLGSQRLKVPNAATEAQFCRNRRVVFIVRQVTWIPPPPPPPPPPSSVIEDRFSVQLLRAATVTASLPLVPGPEAVTLAATLRIVDRKEMKAGLFTVNAGGGGIGFGPWAFGGSLTLGQGPVVKFKIFRLVGRGTIDLKSFEGAVTVYIDGGGGVGPVVRGGTLSFVFDELVSNGANTMPQVIRVRGGTGGVSPGIGGGDVTRGRIWMTGKPVAVFPGSEWL